MYIKDNATLYTRILWMGGLKRVPWQLLISMGHSCTYCTVRSAAARFVVKRPQRPNKPQLHSRFCRSRLPPRSAFPRLEGVPRFAVCLLYRVQVVARPKDAHRCEERCRFGLVVERRLLELTIEKKSPERRIEKGTDRLIINIHN